MDTTIDVVAGDYGYTINFTLQNADSTAFDLTGATLAMKVQKQGTTYALSESMTVVTAASGTCKYLPSSAAFPEEGIYNLQIVCTFSGAVVTFTNIKAVASAKVPTN